MWTETGIKDVYRGVQGACPRRAVTHAGGTAERSERRAVGMGLKLVSCAWASTVASEVLTEAQSFCWLQIKHPNRLLASALSNFLNIFPPGFLST